jgi:predicted esterase
MRPIFTLLVALTLLLAPIAIAEPSAADIQPISDDAYGMLSVFLQYDAAVPLESKLVEVKESDETTRYKIVIRGVRGYWVPGYMEIPKQAQAPYPCVVLMHGWSGSKLSWYEDDNYISGGNTRNALHKLGIATLALDAQAHGDRIAENDYAIVNRYTEDGAPPKKNYFSLNDIMVQTTLDYRRGIDYLLSRDDIDPARIGVWGYSMGGVHAFMVTASDPRVKMAVSVAAPSYVQPYNAYAPMNYAQRLGDRPFLMIEGSEDGMCPQPHAEATIKLISSTEKDLVFYNAGHRLPAKHVKKGIAWVEKHL